MNADFGAGGHTNATTATHDVLQTQKMGKFKTAKRKSLDLHGANNPKFNPKLLEILKDNQEDMAYFDEQTQAANMTINNTNNNGIALNNIAPIPNTSTPSSAIKLSMMQSQMQQAVQISPPPPPPQQQQPPTPKPQTVVQPEIVISHHYAISHNIVKNYFCKV